MAVAYSELVPSAVLGDESAKRELYRDTVKDVYDTVTSSVGPGQTAETLIKDVYTVVFARLGKLRHPEDFPAWVKAITLETVKAHITADETQFIGAERPAPVADDSPTVFIAEVQNAVRETAPKPKKEKKPSPAAEFLAPYIEEFKELVSQPKGRIAIGVILLVLILGIIFIPRLAGAARREPLPDYVDRLNAHAFDVSAKSSADGDLTTQTGDGYLKICFRNVSRKIPVDDGGIYTVYLENDGNFLYCCPCYAAGKTELYGEKLKTGEAEYYAYRSEADDSVVVIISRYALSGVKGADRIYVARSDMKKVTPIPALDYTLVNGQYILTADVETVDRETTPAPDGWGEGGETAAETDTAAAFNPAYLSYAGKTYKEISKKFGAGTYDSQNLVYMFTDRLGYGFSNGTEKGCTSVMTALGYIIDNCPDTLTAAELAEILGPGREEFNEEEYGYAFVCSYRDCPLYVMRTGSVYTPDSYVLFNAIDLPENQEPEITPEEEAYIAATSPANGSYTVLLTKNYEQTDYGLWVSAYTAAPIILSDDAFADLDTDSVVALSSYGLADIEVYSVAVDTIAGYRAIILNETETFLQTENGWEYCDDTLSTRMYRTGSVKLLFTEDTVITDFTGDNNVRLKSIRSFTGSESTPVSVTVAGGRVTEALLGYHHQ